MSSAYGDWLERRDGESLERNEDPLINPLILDTVFKNLEKVKDLRACRLVCKAWNLRIIPIFRHGVKITIHGEKSTKIHTIGNFVEVFGSSFAGIPYSRFRLGSFSTTEGVGQEFLQLCGNEITELDFLDCNMADHIDNYKSENFNVQDISELLKSTPNLETFYIPPHLQCRSGNPIKLFSEDSNSKQKLGSVRKFIVCFDNPKERVKCCPTFIEEFVTAAENIYSFDLWDSSPPGNGESIPILCSSEVFGIIDKLGRDSWIEELKISREETLDVDLFRKMSEKKEGLMLEKLEYSAPHFFSFDRAVRERDSEDPILLQLLSIFKNTLWYLNIHGNRTTSFMGFPVMSCLTKLDISVGLYKKFNFKLPNWNIARIFPVLEELMLIQSDSEYEYDEFFPNSDPCPNMKKFLMLTIRHSSLNVKAVTQMVNMFPNLTDLSIPVKGDGVKIIRLIWSQMTKLKSVSISGPADTMDPVSDLRGYLSLDSLSRIKHIIVMECELTWAHIEILTKDTGLVYWRFSIEEFEDIVPSDDRDSD